MPDPTLAELIGFDGVLEVADVGAAWLGEPPAYKPLVDAGLARLHAFEADARQHVRLREVYGEAIALYAQVLGDGTAQTLNIATPGSGMTSLLKPSAAHLAFFNGFDVFGRLVETQAVATTRLDDVAGLPDLDFLKMDIQGAELTVLHHGTLRLSRAVMVQLEVSFVPLYEDQPTFGEVDVFMRAAGFLPHSFAELKRWSIAPVLRNNDVRQPFNQLLEADIVYARDPMAAERMDDGQIRAMILIAHHAYHSVDLAGRMVLRLESTGAAPAGTFDRYIAFLNTPQGRA